MLETHEEHDSAPRGERDGEDLRRLLTASRLKSARSCRRMHHNAYDLLIKPAIESDVTRFGTLGHVGLEGWWRAAQDGILGNARLSEALMLMRARAKPETDAFELARAEALMRGYHERWADEPYEVIAVEAQFRCDLVNPTTGRASQTWRLAGKIDVIVRDLRTGRVLVVEHKTSSEDVTPGSEYWRRLRMDGQVSIYFVGGAALGHQIDGCLYDVLKKPALRPYKATPIEDRKFKKDGTLYANQREVDETPAEFHARCVEAIAENPIGYYQRGEVARLEKDMAEAMLDIWQLGQELREAELVGRYPRNPGACTQYGRTCPYFAACSGETSLDDPEKFRRIDTPHPELEPAPADS